MSFRKPSLPKKKKMKKESEIILLASTLNLGYWGYGGGSSSKIIEMRK